MITSTMSSQEIADHICSEYKKIERRILGRVKVECEKLIRLKRSTMTFTECTKNITVFTTYIAGPERGLHTTGVWYDSPRGKVFAVASIRGVNIITKHFFERYAERFINKAAPLKEAAKHFFYKNTLQGIYLGEVFGTEDNQNQIAVVYEQGVALGTLVSLEYSVLNTFIANDMLFKRQLELTDKIRKESDNGRKIVALRHNSENQELEAFSITNEQNHKH